MTDPVGGAAAPGGDQGPQRPPVCPRHPDRESYVRCQRCERPACPECQRPAAVGVHCVDCVREASRTGRQARTAFGGQVRRGRPVVTLTLIGACVVVFLLQMTSPFVTQDLAFRPILAGIEPWRFLTAAFLHGGWVHIAFNMYVLFTIGTYLEQVLGRSRFAAVYLVSALGGSVGSLLLASPDTTSWIQASVGASGAVFGLFGALLVIQRKLRQNPGQIVVLILINGVIGFVVPNIAWQAHLGGLVTGAALGAVMAFAPQRVRTPVQLVGTGVVLLVLLLAAVAKLAATGYLAV